MFRVTAMLLLSLSVLASTAAGLKCPADECDPDPCLTDPECSCSGWEPDIPLKDRPQIVYLTFGDVITSIYDQDYYSELFESGNFANPNGCPIRGTFFLSHLYNDYVVSSKYWALGNELAPMSITRGLNATYWDVNRWTLEVSGMRDMIVKYANLPNTDDIQCMRAPGLQIGGNSQFEMLLNENFTYDSSMISREYGYTNLDNGWWPYSLDYRNTMDCQIGPCPTCSFPGVWEQPILELEDNWYGQPDHPDVGSPCTMLDSCIITSGTEPEDVFEMMQRNFNRSYYGNTRAPIGFHLHAAWFVGQPWHFDGYKMFLDYALAFDDVYIVPIRDGIEYMKNPVPVPELPDFGPFGCDNLPDEDYCQEPRSCRYTNVNLGEDGYYPELYMNSCVECPPNYPWLGNVDGN